MIQLLRFERGHRPTDRLRSGRLLGPPATLLSIIDKQRFTMHVNRSVELLSKAAASSPNVAKDIAGLLGESAGAGGATVGDDVPERAAAHSRPGAAVHEDDNRGARRART